MRTTKNRGPSERGILAGCAWAAALLLPLAGCGEPMPETRPADFQLTYNNHAGMRKRSVDLRIHGREARFRYHFDRESGERTVTLSDATLDSLWAELRREEFTGIESEDRGKVYDRGGTTITIGWGGRRHSARDAGNMFIRGSSFAAWREVRGAVGRLIVEHFGRLPDGAPLPGQDAPPE